MKRKGWWQQLRDNDYPETKKSYGQDIHAIDPRIRPKNLEALYDLETRSTNDSSEENVSTTENYSVEHDIYIFCKSCSYEKLLTDEFMEELRERLSIDISSSNTDSLQQKLSRLKCSRCGDKNADLLSKNMEQKSYTNTHDWLTMDTRENKSVERLHNSAIERLAKGTAEDRRCRHCGKLAILGDGVCYTCASSMK